MLLIPPSTLCCFLALLPYSPPPPRPTSPLPRAPPSPPYSSRSLELPSLLSSCSSPSLELSLLLPPCSSQSLVLLPGAPPLSSSPPTAPPLPCASLPPIPLLLTRPRAPSPTLVLLPGAPPPSPAPPLLPSLLLPLCSSPPPRAATRRSSPHSQLLPLPRAALSALLLPRERAVSRAGRLRHMTCRRPRRCTFRRLQRTRARSHSSGRPRPRPSPWSRRGRRGLRAEPPGSPSVATRAAACTHAMAPTLLQKLFNKRGGGAASAQARPPKEEPAFR